MNILKKWWWLFIYKPGTKKLYWEKIISSIAVLIAFGIWGYFNQTKVNQLRKQRNTYTKYTIGTTTGSYNNVKGHRYIHYRYFIHREKFSDSGDWPWLDNSVTTRGGRYFVKLDSTNYSNVEILFRCPVPDYIHEAPDSGWNKLPIDCN